jgi:hypothetical protein
MKVIKKEYSHFEAGKLSKFECTAKIKCISRDVSINTIHLWGHKADLFRV